MGHHEKSSFFCLRKIQCRLGSPLLTATVCGTRGPSEVKRNGGGTLALNYLGPEVTHVTSTHSPLPRTGHLATAGLTLEGAGKCRELIDTAVR